MTDKPRSVASVLRRIVAVVILVPLALVVVAFAVANRQFVTVSFDPFDAAEPAASVTLPLFLPLFAVAIAGVLIGGFASWLRHGHWRRTSRRLEREVNRLRQDIEAHRRAAGAAPVAAEPVRPPERLKLQAPVR